MIATDSTCSIDKIAKHLRDRMPTINDLHQPMLQAIVNMLIERARNGDTTTILKVKSHIGIDGNKVADELVAAAEAMAAGQPVDRDVSQQYCEDLDMKFWPQKEVSSAANDVGEANMQNVRDLGDSLADAVHNKLKLGQSNQESVYFNCWKRLQPFTSAKFSNQFWNMSAITKPMLVNTLKYRFGRLWNKKLAYMMKAPYLPGDAPARDMECPLCGLDDAAGHILGGCRHKEMSAMYIARHDKAMRKVIQEAVKGEHGNFYIIADVGKIEGLRDIGVHSKRIPKLCST